MPQLSRVSSRAFVAWRWAIRATSKASVRAILEMRIDFGPGYRVYYMRRGATVVILLCAGDKRTQRQDIKRAQELAEMH
jgi:putative addiction module killer protein